MTVVHLQPQARQDLSDALRYLGSYSDEAALRLADAFDEAVQRLTLFPESGSRRETLGTDIRALVMPGFGLVVYHHTLRGDAVTQVLILRVLHQTRDVSLADFE